MSVLLSPEEARALIWNALTGSGTSPENAEYFTDAILDTELSGLEGHGFYWLQYYCAHLRSGKVDGKAVPQVEALSDTSFRVDARHGFAHPAIEAGFKHLIPAAKAHGVAAMGVYNSYNAATLGFHTGYLARAGLLASGCHQCCAKSRPGGRQDPDHRHQPDFLCGSGTGRRYAFLVDQSATQVAWTAVKRAAEAGEPIPLGWALDAEGDPQPMRRPGLPGRWPLRAGSKGSASGFWSRCFAPPSPGANWGRIRGPSLTTTASPSTTASSLWLLIRANCLAAVSIKRSLRLCLDHRTRRCPPAKRDGARRTSGDSQNRAFRLSRDFYETLKGFA